MGVKEVGENEFLTAEETHWREHSTPARSKRVISGPVMFAQDPANENRNLLPLSVAVGAASASLALSPNKIYRLISTTDCHFLLANGVIAATTGDIYLPKDTPTIIRTTSLWKTLNVIQASASGVIQAAEIS